MILDWIENESLRKEEQLMNVLYDCGMATFDQLRIITGWSERSLRYHISALYQRNKRDMDPDSREKKWIQAHYASRQFKEAVYTLGSNAMKHVHEIREDDRKARNTPLGQIIHFVKTNEVLVRALKTFERSHIRWFSSYEATDSLIVRWNQTKAKKLDRRTSIRPDAKMYIQNEPYYIEFDNGTEGPRQIERKFHAYVNILPEIKDRAPIIWVTSNVNRKEYLYKNWAALCQISYTGQPVPEMRFFLEGEDIHYFCDRHAGIRVANKNIL